MTTTSENGNGTTTTRRGRKSTKSLTDVASKVAADSLVDPISKEAKKARKAKVVQATTDLTVEKALKGILATRVGVGQALDSIVTDLQSKFEESKILDESIELKREELETLHDKDVVLSSTAELLARHEEFKKKLATEEAESKEALDRSQREYERAFNELKAEKDKQYKRDIADYEYNIQLERKKAQDKYEEEMRIRRLADNEKAEMLTKSWEAREAVLVEKENEFNKYKAEFEAMPAKIDAEVKKHEHILRGKLEKEHKDEINQITMNFESQRTVMNMQIKQSTDTINELRKTIQELREEVTSAREQQQNLAVKSIEAAAVSGQNTLAAVATFGKGGDQSKK